jgi:hypothetical protein
MIIVAQAVLAVGSVSPAALDGHYKILDSAARPIVLGVIAVVLIVRFGLLWSSESHQGESASPASYGLAGGAICSRCGRPFPLSMLSPHVFGLKLARCPHCGRWGMVGRASQQDLAAAEHQDAPPNAAAPVVDEAEALRRRIEESRYE